jgi:hypothetical protein
MTAFVDFFGKGCFYVLCYVKYYDIIKYMFILYMFILGGNCSEYTMGCTTAVELVFGTLPPTAVAQ